MATVKVLKAILSRISTLRAALDIRVFFFFGGLGMLGFGLHLLQPWIAFTVCGILLMLIGWAMREDKG
jgi:hypothetical protein